MQAEAVRQFYLGAAGIRMWYARAPLPGASPSPEYDFDTGDTETARGQKPVGEAVFVDKSDPERAARSKGKIAHLQNLMSSVEQPSQKTKGQLPPSSEPEPVNGSEVEAGLEKDHETVGEQVDAPEVPVVNAPRLCVQVWKGHRVVLVAHISEESSLSLQETLALNILRSIGELTPVSVGLVRWPLFNNLRISLNSPDHLVEVLRAHFGDLDNRQVIVLGEGGSWLEGALSKDPDLVFPGTLAKLASDPSLKRELWRLIRSVARK